MVVTETVVQEDVPSAGRRSSRVPAVVLATAALWFVFAVLQELLTGKVWFWVLPGLAPPIVFAVVPALLLLAAIPLKRFRAPVLALVIASFLVNIPSSGINYSALLPADRPAAEGSRVRVVQMNTDYWGQLREGTLTDRRDKESMLRYLRALDADVYLLQEHMTRDGDLALPVTDLSDVARAFPEYRAIAAGTLLTLTRLPVVDHKIVNQETGSDLNLPPPPYELMVNVRVGNTVLSTYNIHMPIQIIIEQNWFTRDFYREIERRHAIRSNEFRILARDVAANPNPLIVAGDFNTSPAMGDIRGLLDVTRDAASSSGRLYPATWRVGGQLPMLWRNDWYLIRNNITVDEFRSLDPEGNSDHLVQAVNLLITEK
ncbi:endonuclease/exonuclease/phosphatase family protein [Actinoplanes sp. NPDC023801]|uniref:endonuclease/exonuclease/phosphatase family protein n=1 Tax=Actinoplanes sp. NPDC023801 TaxID=3154595 RepID=UPI0033E1B43E